MKPRRTLSLLAGLVLIGGVAKCDELPLDAQASLLDDAAGTVATDHVATGSTAETSTHIPEAAQDTREKNDAVQRQVAAGAKPALANPLWKLPLEQLSTTRERPIFSPSRRPPPPAHVAPVAVRQPAKPQEPERPTMALVGTIIGADEGYRMAIFLDTSTQDVLRLHVGENYHGWVVSLINQRDASLMKNGQQALLELSGPGAALSPVRSGRDTVLERVWQVGAD